MALMIKGITPGPNVARDQLELFWGMIASMWIGNAMLVILNLPLVGGAAEDAVPVSAAGDRVLFDDRVFTVSNSAFDVFFGVLGYAFHKVGVPAGAGLLLEQHFRRAMVLSHSDSRLFVTHPISGALLAAAGVALALIVLPSISRKREEVFVDEE